MTISAGASNLHPAFYVIVWMFFSNTTILFNKWLIGTAGFKYPIIITAIHLTITVVCTQLLARFTTLLPVPARPVLLTRQYIWYVFGIGLCYTASLLCSNLAYLTLSVSFISMLKALAPVTTLVLSYVGNFSEPTGSTWAKVAVITFGVFLSSIGEVKFAWDGFMFQMFGTVSESLRLLLIGWLLTTGAAPVEQEQETTAQADSGPEQSRDVNGDNQSDDGAEKPDAREPEDIEAQGTPESSGAAATPPVTPLLLLYYYAPVCAVFNVLVALMTEWPTFDVADLHRVGWGMLALNGAVAFMLNVSSVFLIGKTSALAMNLTGILKSVLLVFGSIIIWNTTIMPIQAGGYAIALLGLLIYALPDDFWKDSRVAEIALTYVGVYAVKIGNRLGLLGLGSNWGRRGSLGGEGRGRYMNVPDSAFEEHDDSIALSAVSSEEGEGRKNDEAEAKERLAKD